MTGRGQSRKFCDVRSSGTSQTCQNQYRTFKLLLFRRGWESRQPLTWIKRGPLELCAGRHFTKSGRFQHGQNHRIERYLSSKGTFSAGIGGDVRPCSVLHGTNDIRCRGPDHWYGTAPIATLLPAWKTCGTACRTAWKTEGTTLRATALLLSDKIRPDELA
jgi:hypothetical protein